MARKNSHPRKGAKKRYQIELSSFSLLLWGFCALFFMAWIFVLGVFVGRGFLPGADSPLTDLKTQVAKLQEMVAKSKRGEPASQTKETIDETLAFYEKLESKKDEAKKLDQNQSTSKNGTKQRSRDRAKGEIPASDSHARAETLKPGHGDPPSAPPAGTGRYTLQLASLEEKAKAETMVGDLLKKGHDAYFYEVRVKGKTFYRVRCGRFMTREEADAYAAKLVQSLNIRGFVIKFE
jgi:cell division septation protein DedD